MSSIQDEFISTISHEIRTPLTSIKGFSQTMLDNWAQLDENKKKKFLTIINEQSQRLIKLVENVLNVAKIDAAGDAPGDEFVLRKVDLERVAKKTTDLIKMNFKEHNFVVLPSKAPLTVLCDEDYLQQILVNILENAAKYSRAGSNVEVSFAPQGDFNVVTVRDEGAGIAPEDLDKIFEKFYRSDDFLTSKTQGSGLGLYIAQNLAKKMGGKIEVESKVKEGRTGTKFTVFLPVFEIEKLTRGAAGAATGAASATKGGAGGKNL